MKTEEEIRQRIHEISEKSQKNSIDQYEEVFREALEWVLDD